MFPEGETFAQYAHRIVGGQLESTIRDAADRMGVKYHFLYSRLRGRARFTIDEAIAFVKVMGDLRLARRLLHGTGFVASVRAEGGTSSTDMRRGATSVVQQAVNLLTEVDQALEDEILTDQERRILLSRIAEAEAVLATLRNQLGRDTSA